MAYREENDQVIPDLPEGYHYEWQRDSGWIVGGDGRKCRRKGCQNPAVASLDRGHPKNRFWHYCAEHLYGRKLENGEVRQKRLVANGEVRTA